MIKQIQRHSGKEIISDNLVSDKWDDNYESSVYFM